MGEAEPADPAFDRGATRGEREGRRRPDDVPGLEVSLLGGLTLRLGEAVRLSRTTRCPRH
jgi:hypothetical protein